MSPNAFHQALPQSDLTVLEQTWFEDFQAGHRAGHLVYRNGTILSIMKFYVAPVIPIKFQLAIWEEMSFKDFKMANMATILDIGTK